MQLLGKLSLIIHKMDRNIDDDLTKNKKVKKLYPNFVEIKKGCIKYFLHSLPCKLNL